MSSPKMSFPSISSGWPGGSPAKVSPGRLPWCAAIRTTRGCHPASIDLALLVHMYHEVQQPYGLLWNLRPALRPGARVAVIDARKQTETHGTPPDLLRCELAAVGYQQTAFYDLQESTYLAVFALPNPPAGPTSPAAIRPCVPGRS